MSEKHTNATHDPSMHSWVESANDPATEFPIQNLALCAFEAQHDGHTHGHLGVAIGDQILDVSTLAMSGVLGDPEGELAYMLHAPGWNFVAGSPHLWAEVRTKLQEFLRADSGGGQRVRRLREKSLRPIAETKLLLPMTVFDYTDFYASRHHATNVGSMFRPDNPLLPNYKHVPIGYHGRASSLVVSGTPVRRPLGQQAPPDGEPGAGPTFGPCKLLDYEMELGVYTGRGNRLGDPIPMSNVGESLFGMCILNDWSARDLQKWEYQPLGPFLAKNFASTLSPFIVTMDALAPFRTEGPRREPGDPQPLPYLRGSGDWNLDITVEVWLQSEQMRQKSLAPIRISRGSFADMYWTVDQLMVHHASNGCNMQPGDLLGSGTISGTSPESRGCLLERTWQGNGSDGKPLPRKAIELPSGETRTFLADGDEVIMRAFCEREGFRRIGFGECRGRILPAPSA